MAALSHYSSKTGIYRLVIAVLIASASDLNIARATPPGTVVDFSNPISQIYLGNPSIAILPNGDYVVSHDLFGPGHPYSEVALFRSQDRGATWSSLGKLLGQYESTLFVQDQSLYILGGGTTDTGEFVSIRSSTNGGQTWSVPSSSTTGRLVTGGNFNAGATSVLTLNGRVWRAMERVDPSMPVGNSTNWRSFVLSAPVGSDLLNASNWTVSNSLLMNNYISGAGWLEGGVVATPQGAPATFLRTALLGEKAAIINISANGSTATFQSATGLVDFPAGGSNKFTVRYDAPTGRYWSLTNNLDRPGDVRNVLQLVSSPDLVNWTEEGTILSHPDPVNVGFQYADWQFEGNDIIFVSRTAYDNAHNFHDANYVTFHRIANFRSFLLDSASTVSSTNDGFIDQHVNYNMDPLGVATFGHSHGLGATKENIVVGRLANDYTNPVTGPSKIGVITFDVSGLTGELVTNVTLSLVQTVDASNPPNRGGAQFAATTDIYVVNSGDFAENTSTWQNYIGGTGDAALTSYLASGAITLLGSMANVSNPGGAAGSGGVTTFVDADLNSVVQSWIDGTKPNYGLLLLNSATLGSAPASPNDVFARYASHESNSFSGPKLIISHAPLNMPGDFNNDGSVDAADYVVWRDSLGHVVAVGTLADGDRNGRIDQADYDVWKEHFGDGAGAGQSLSRTDSAVPEPASWALLGLSFLACALCRSPLYPRN